MHPISVYITPISFIDAGRLPHPRSTAILANNARALARARPIDKKAGPATLERRKASDNKNIKPSSAFSVGKAFKKLADLVKPRTSTTKDKDEDGDEEYDHMALLRRVEIQAALLLERD